MKNILICRARISQDFYDFITNNHDTKNFANFKLLRNLLNVLHIILSMEGGLQWYHSLANIQIFKSRFVNFCATSHFFFKYINIYNAQLQDVGQGHRVQFSQLDHSMANVQIYKCLPHMFALSLTISDIYIYIYIYILPPKCRSRLGSTNFVLTPFDGKCQILQMSPTHFCASSHRFEDIKISIFLP